MTAEQGTTVFPFEPEVVEKFFDLCRDDHHYDYDGVYGILRKHPQIVNVRRDSRSQDTTPLLEACHTGALTVIKILLRNGADVGGTGRMGGYHSRTPLGSHIFEGNDFREGGFGVYDDVFPLYVASSAVRTHVIRELIAAGADLNQTTAAGQSALHVASAQHDGHYSPGLLLSWCLPEDPVELMHYLIEGGANVNLQDNMGRTPLHYACMFERLHLIKLLLEKGADPGIRDKFGKSILEVAAHNNSQLMKALLNLYSWSDKEKIEAYEIATLTDDLDRQSFNMSEASNLRVKLNCPKIVLDPLECFANMREWETMSEIERLGQDYQTLREHCLIARERIYQGRRYPLEERNITGVVLGVQNRVQKNALLRHYLQVFRRNEDYLYFTDIFFQQGRLLQGFVSDPEMDVHLLETATIVDIINLSFESAVRVRNALGIETKRGNILALISEFEKCLLTAGSYILVLFCRARHSDEFEADNDIARLLLKKLIEDFPHVSYSATDYYNPLLNIMLNKKYDDFMSEIYPVLPDVEMIKMMLDYESIGVNKADSEGNTALHVAISPYPVRSINIGDGSPLPTDPYHATESAVRLLLDKGAYVYARNKSKQTVFDILNDPEHADFYSLTPNLSKMLEKCQSFPTLQRLTAEYLRDANIALVSQLPIALKDFVGLH